MSNLDHTMLQISYFASARDAAGTSGEVLPSSPGETVAQLRTRLGALHPLLVRILPYARFALADEFARDDDAVPPGAEVLVLPAASGGAPRCELRDTAIDRGEAERRVTTEGAGGVVTFDGIVRRENLGKSVQHLEYTAHAALALQEMERLCDEAIAQFGLVDVCCLHRTGVLQVGDVAASIAVTAAHRDAAFAGCRFVIDELKKRVPIWKKETTADGSSWLGSTP